MTGTFFSFLSFHSRGSSPPWKPDGVQTDRHCDTTDSDAGQPITRGRPCHGANGPREPKNPWSYAALGRMRLTAAPMVRWGACGESGSV
nr:MAG TPA: hypothetical protein [Caudoviricetes sp.]